MPVTAFPFECKNLTSEGTFSGLAATYDNTDLQKDVIRQGAFEKTLRQRGSELPLLWQHSAAAPIGLISLSDSPQGLMPEGRLSMGLRQAQEAYILLRDRIVKGLSIGFETIRSEFKGDVRELLELRLFEVSLVTFPANEQALIGSVKSASLNEIARLAEDLKAFYADLKR